MIQTCGKCSRQANADGEFCDRCDRELARRADFLLREARAGRHYSDLTVYSGRENEAVAPRRLLIMACGASKVPGVRRSFEKYAGTSHKTRAAVERASGWRGFELLILSAEFGLTKGDTHIPDYDRRMTPERAAEQVGRNVPMLRAIIEAAAAEGDPFVEVFLFCSPDYVAALGRFEDWQGSAPVRVVAKGRGIGDQVSELKAWILERGAEVYPAGAPVRRESLEEWLSRRPHLRKPVRPEPAPAVCWLQSPTLSEWLEAFPGMRRAAML
jgi:hypothetical protein